MKTPWTEVNGHWWWLLALRGQADHKTLIDGLDILLDYQ